ncbi:MAG: TonB-dependent receptor plug domain-containing protein [Saprospiraceae bacterium]|nr:TonB-dependent receptor plug domain-containing protein [Saprospiraceae bacterium]
MFRFNMMVPLCLIASSWCNAQWEDSTFLLPPAVVEGRTIAPLVQLDSLTLALRGQQTLTEALQEIPQLFVRNYGPGSLGTMSLMGGTSSHTTLEWNGISLRNPMLGQNDLSLLPINIFSDVSIDVHGGSAANGNTQLNGTIQLHSRIPKENGFSGSIETGSWGRVGLDFHAIYGRFKAVKSQTRIYGLRSQNNFAFFKAGERSSQTHASIQNAGFMHQSSIHRVFGQPLEVSVWWQDNKQEIPPTVTQSNSEATQETTSLRVSLNWNQQSDGRGPRVTMGLISEGLHFIDPAMALDAESKYQQVSLKLEQRLVSVGVAHLYVGMDDRFTAAQAPNYGGNRHENQLEGHTRWVLKTKRSRWQFALRQGFLDEAVMPLAASLSMNTLILQGLRLDASVSRDLRYATLNERFWQPGGNEDLREETSYGAVMGVRYGETGAADRWMVRLQTFYRNTEDWILWTPLEGQVYWSAQNLSSVWSRGWSIDAQYSRSLRLISFDTKLVYSYTRSTNQKAISQPRIPEGQQLFYTPLHKAVVETGIELSGIRLTYIHTWTGGYPGVQEDLPAFHLGQVNLKLRELDFGASLMRAWFQMDNVWNTDYRMIERRPMPLRSVRFGVHLSW